MRIHKKIYGAEEDSFDFLEEDSISDSIEDLSDKVEDVQDQIEDVDEDEIDIDMDNNISDHYIAECDRCHGIFISAVVESEESIDHITGECPLCGKETDQYLKWIIRDITEE